MAWARIDDNFFNHPKVRKAGKDAVMFHIAALCYSNAFRTDGFINDDTLELIAIQAFLKRANGYADKLVECKLWWRVEGGYQIHDYLEYNKSKTEIETMNDARRTNGKQGGRPKQNLTTGKKITETKPNQVMKNNLTYNLTHNQNLTESKPINPSHINPIKDTTTTMPPSDFQPFAEVYESVTGSEPKVLNAEIEAVQTIIQAGGTPADFRKALQGLQDKDYGISSMASALTWTLKDIEKRKRPARVNNDHKPKRSELDDILDGAPIFAEDK